MQINGATGTGPLLNLDNNDHGMTGLGDSSIDLPGDGVEMTADWKLRTNPEMFASKTSSEGGEKTVPPEKIQMQCPAGTEPAFKPVSGQDGKFDLECKEKAKPAPKGKTSPGGAPILD